MKWRSKRRRELWERAKGACFYCGRITRLPEGNVPLEADHATLDHVIPRALGGGTHKKNLVLACYRCNQEKAATQPTNYFEGADRCACGKLKDPSADECFECTRN